MAKHEAKPGRPKSDEKLGIQIFTRVSESISLRLEAAAKDLERAPAWIVRRGLGGVA